MFAPHHNAESQVVTAATTVNVYVCGIPLGPVPWGILRCSLERNCITELLELAEAKDAALRARTSTPHRPAARASAMLHPVESGGHR